MSTPQGPYEMNPIKGTTHQENFTDFRPQPGEFRTAFQDHMEQTAFNAEQAAKADAERDAEQLLGGREPVTAFEVEMLRSRNPLGVRGSVQDSSLSQQMELDLNQDPPVTNATAEKESKTGPPAPTGPTPPSLPSQNPGPSTRSA